MVGNILVVYEFESVLTIWCSYLLVDARTILSVFSFVSTNAPTVNLCGACKEPETWDNKAVMCKDCIVWYHITCQNISY